MLPLKSIILLFFFLVLLLEMEGCAGKKVPVPIMVTVEGVSGPFKVGQILDLQAGKALSFEQFIRKIRVKDVIFVGEVHDNPDHHLIQVQILQALMDYCGSVDVAMEFFQKPQQPILDRYMRGEITEDEFLQEVDWKQEWGYDYHLYRPLMLLAKQNGSRVLAINAPRDIVRKVARHGLKGLDTQEREELAEVIDVNNEAHRNYLREVFEGHTHGDLKFFEYFYEAQCVWEDTMAQNLAKYYKKEQRKLIVFTGNGHIIYKFGIPDRTVRRVPVSIATIVPSPLYGKRTIEKKYADYVWFTAE